MERPDGASIHSVINLLTMWPPGSSNTTYLQAAPFCSIIYIYYMFLYL